MKHDRWKKIEILCQEAMTLHGEERTTYLINACADDKDLLEEVMSLLEQEDSEQLQEPLVQIRSSLLFSDDAGGDQVIGPYRLIRLLGTGGMGHVYLAVRNDEQFERFVALKVIKEGVVSDDVLSRFMGERQILASLNHSNISRLFDGGTTDSGLPWFAMEYVEGTPITDYCERRHLTLDEKLDLFLKVCSAVQYAHQNLVIHRDLKPANILITENGHPKLLDFGIAKLMDLEQDPGVTQYQNRLMTPEYASPEQVKHDPVSTVSDVYSLGVLLYELLTGTLPYRFDKRSPAHIEDVISNEIPPKPSGISGKARLKGDLDNIILKALRKSPDERYSSVEQFVQDIRRYQNALPVIAQKDSFAYRTGKFLQRHTWSVAVSAAISLLILSFATVTYIQSKTIEARAIEAENERDRAEEISNFLIGLFESVDPSEARNESLSAVELLHRGAERVDNELTDQPELQSELYLVVSDVYQKLGLYDDGIEMARNALSLQRNLHGEKHPGIATSLNALGWLYHQKGEYERSDSLLQAGLTMRREIYEGEHLDIARSLNDLAVLKQAQGNYEATDSLLAQALEIRRNILGEQAEEVAVPLSNYAALKWRMGDLDAAEEHMREALSIFQSTVGNEDLRVPVTMTNLAAILLSRRNKDQGNIDEAESLYRQALDIRYQLVGEEHPGVAYSLVHLGNLLRAKGEYEEAEELLLKALELRKKLLGDEHVLVGVSNRVLAELYFDSGDYFTAEQYYLSAMEIFKEIYPNGHVRTARVLHNLGDVYLEMDEPIQAEPLFREAMEIRMRVFGSNDSRSVASMIKLGICLSETGEATESKLLLESGLEILKTSENGSNELRELAENRLAGL